MNKQPSGQNKSQSYNKKIRYLCIILFFVFAVGTVFFKVIQDSKQNEEIEENKLLIQNQEIINQTDSLIETELPVISEQDHYQGDLNAEIKIVVYEDYSNAFSAQLADTLNRIQKDILIVFRHYALRNYDLAIHSALAVECASEQNNFLEMRQLLFLKAKEDSIQIEELSNYAKELDLDTNQFQDCFDQEKYFDKIKNQTKAGKQAGVYGVPTSFINNQKIIGAIPWEDFVDQNDDEQLGLKSIVNKY